MGFSGNTTSFTRFRLLDTVPDDAILKIPDKLRQFSFKDIDDIPEMRSFGWVCYEDMLDSEWVSAPPHKGEYLLFSLRLDTRRIPAGVIKKHLTIALRDEKLRLVEDDKKFISRDRKKEIKEKVLLQLRQRFLPVPAEFNVIWNTRDNTVWFASVQTKMIELFMEYFLASFEARLEEFSPYNLACALLPEDRASLLDNIEETAFIQPSSPNQIILAAIAESPDMVLGEEFLTWLWYKSDTMPDSFLANDGMPFSVSMEQRIVVRGGSGEARETATVSGPLSPLREARFGLGTGKKVTRALIRIEKGEIAFQFSLGADDFRIGSLKTPKLDHADKDDDQDALILEKIYLVEICLGLLDTLYKDFLNLRLSSDWSGVADKIGQWFTKTE